MIRILKSAPRLCLFLLFFFRGIESAIPIVVIAGFVFAKFDLPVHIFFLAAGLNFFIVVKNAMVEATRLPVLIYFRIWECLAVLVFFCGLGWAVVLSFMDLSGEAPYQVLGYLTPILLLALVMHGICSQAFYTMTPSDRIAWVSRYFEKLKTTPIRWRSELALASYRIKVLRIYLEQRCRITKDKIRSREMSKLTEAGGITHASLDPEGFFKRLENQMRQINRIFESVAN